MESTRTLEAILSDHEEFTPLQQLATQAVEVFGLEGTPTFFINSQRIVGGISAAEMTKLLEAELAR